MRHGSTGGDNEYRTFFVVVEVLEGLQQLILVASEDALYLRRLLGIGHKHLHNSHVQLTEHTLSKHATTQTLNTWNASN